MIEKVNNLNKKSFFNYTGPEDRFSEVNIIFGYNGRGKTSLAKGIAEEFLKDKNNCENNIRFFSRKYITNNLLLEDRDDSKLKGVIANFGQKDIEVEKQIKDLQSKIVDTNELENEIIKLDKDIRLEIDKIHEEKKGDILVSKKSKYKSNEEIIALYQEDIKSAKKIENNEEKLLNIKGDNTIEKKIEKIENIVIPIISNLKVVETEKLKEILKKQYDDVNIPSSKIISWISEGVDFHKEGEVCKFCGGEINLPKIKEKLEEYSKNEKQKDSIILEKFNKILNNVILEINNLLILKESIIVNLEKDVTSNFENIEKNKVLLENLVFKVNTKIENINEIIEFNEEDLNIKLNEIAEDYKEIVNEKNRMLKELNKKKNKINILIKGAIGIEINRNTFINTSNKIVMEKKNQLMKIKKENIEKVRAIEKLKQEKSNTKDFADHISNILSMLEINLKLEVADNDYIIKQSITDDKLTIEDISEGEQNLLALLYFYYELFNDKEQIELKNEIKLIIIDDPIASVDDVNKMYVLELVKKINELSNVQIFTFTHVWEDFCNICYGKQDKSKYKFFEVKKDINGSKIDIAKTNETPYKHNFKEIYEFSQKSDCSNLSDCEIYHYPNIMRKILEEYLSFKVKKNSPTLSNINNIKLALCGDKISANDELRIGMLLNVCNIFSHKASRNPDEILKSAKFLMNKIKDRDKLHFYTMIN